MRKDLLQKLTIRKINWEFFVFLFFLVLSCAFWFASASNDTYEAEIDMEVQLVNVPKNVVITTPPTDTIKVVVSDKGFMLFPMIFGHYTPTLSINFESHAKGDTEYGQVSSGELKKIVTQSLHGSTRVVSIKPDKLDFHFNYGISKKVPVKLVSKVTPAETYYLAQTTVEPQEVLVYASKEKLASIHYAETQVCVANNFTDTLSMDMKLATEPGIKFEPATVKVTFFADVLTEEVIEVPITPVNVPAGTVLRLFPSRVKVKFTVGASAWRTVKPEMFEVTADYNSVKEHPDEKCALQLVATPDIVRNPSLTIESVDYLIEQP